MPRPRLNPRQSQTHQPCSGTFDLNGIAREPRKFVGNRANGRRPAKPLAEVLALPKSEPVLGSPLHQYAAKPARRTTGHAMPDRCLSSCAVETAARLHSCLCLPTIFDGT
ncbi:hypothetical protein Ahu01nite_031990 [Winogradskya humida]|uniref:Uncharacterized protein n=1 Tax=Winogradskya humida TaxID=113566 RepID=A0ABQ3ZNH4_9ACTN|nr:hypothetical protein Ahu01nite_031990 [Actinoplanes humidus]